MRQLTLFEPESIQWAAFAAQQPRFGAMRQRHTAAQKAGMAYERRAQGYLCELYPETYVPSPWLVFRVKREPMLRWCQPDGLILDLRAGLITLIEIKLRHMPEAYMQLSGIYLPVLQRIFARSGFRYKLCEFVRWYDPAVAFPVPVQLVSDIALTPSGRFGVHIWN